MTKNDEKYRKMTKNIEKNDEKLQEISCRAGVLGFLEAVQAP
jgi:hypothetical protein